MNETLLNQLIKQAISDEVDARELTVDNNSIDGIKENVLNRIISEIDFVVSKEVDNFEEYVLGNE